MYLAKISVINFKNYVQADLELSPKINCFVGDNGVGKTNLLDAIHYLALCKSNLNPVDTQNIRYDSEFSVIQGIFQRKGKEETIYCSIRRNKKKQFKRNKKDYKRLAEHIGFIPVVMISPFDYALIQGGSEERRKFINSAIGQYDRIYLENVISYNRVLSQRNKLLKEGDGNDQKMKDVMEALDHQLIQYGVPVFESRKEFVGKLNPVFQRFYQHVSGKRENVTLEYASHLLENNFKEVLLSSRKKDLILQYTTTGIHKDEMTMQLEGHSLKKVGSQGQQKTYLTALKLAEFEFMQDIMQLPPLLLLDDIFDKFDAFRVKQIISLVAENNFGQIFITDTSESRMTEILKELPVEQRVFQITNDGINLKNSK
ncbi:MAG: DNA replication and repair protein RecF [Bacteroidales bacterium]|nr:DNA replication and repair protein RecF [Bacteroidales bacterium]